MRATPPVRFCFSRTLFFGLSFCLLFLTACQTTSLTLDERWAKAIGQTPADAPAAGKAQASSSAAAQTPKASASKPPEGRNVLAEVSTILEGKGKSRISPEALLEAEGNMSMVDELQEYDPAAEHLKARSKVDTHRKTKVAELAPHFDPDVDEARDAKFRVLKIQKNEVRENAPQVVMAQGPELLERADKEDAAREESSVGAPSGVYQVLSTGGPPIPAPGPALAALTESGVVIPGRKPAVHVAHAVMLAQEETGRGAPIVPLRKPADTTPAAQAVPEALARIAPAAGSAGEAAQVLPGRKPQRAPASGAVAVVPHAPAKPKTEFMPVKLQPLRGATSLEPDSVPSAQILRMRAGEESGRTRVVLELRGEARFEARLDNAQKVLLVDVEGAVWAAGEGTAFHSLSIVRGFRVENLPGGGTQVLLDLKKDSKLLQAASLGTDKAGITRIVIDLRNG